MLKKWIAGVIGGITVGNGLFMLLDGQRWYHTIPGVHDTGPFNGHFVADIGAAFSVAGVGLVVRAWRSQYWPAALAGASFLSFHAVIHVIGLVGGHSHHAGFEWVSVVVPSGLAVWAAFPEKGERSV